MISRNSRLGGPLTDSDSSIYVLRAADNEVVRYLQSMEYVLIIEPRQQGKTSLTNRLIYSSVLGKTILIYIDVSSCDHSGESGWYESLYNRIISQLIEQTNIQLQFATPKNSIQWRDFLKELSIYLVNSNQKAVIILDEIGNSKFDKTTEFFIVLRDIYNSRQAEKYFRNLTFFLLGSFHPSNLIQDDLISPFNVAQQIILDDFTIEQIQDLIREIIPDQEYISNVSDRIHFWTGGQPYLTQLLISYLDGRSTADDIDKCVHRICREDKNHLPPLFKKLINNEKLTAYANRILMGERIKYFPAANPIQAELELLGLIKDDVDGNCCIRNKICQLGLRIFGGTQQFDVFLCHNSIDKDEVKRIGHELKALGIVPWLDVWELPPGLPWQRLIEQQIEQIRSAAVFIGKEGIGPWQRFEIEALLREFVARGCPVIPVLLPSAPSKPDIPKFLQSMTWVDFRVESPSPINSLIWGITGKRKT